MIARHERSQRKGAELLVLDHYLEVLLRKPGALPGANALAPARAAAASPQRMSASGGALANGWATRRAPAS